jgi:hypothetical protein
MSVCLSVRFGGGGADKRGYKMRATSAFAELFKKLVQGQRVVTESLVAEN